MRNVFLIPTDKPSNIISYSDGILAYQKGKQKGFEKQKPQNIYITNDEEIKVGDYCINLAHNLIVKPTDAEWANSNHNNLKKIILTDNQDLIKDGVQEIDNEFLEWFVNNSSCEFVDIEKVNVSIDKIGYIIYKLKEEPKQETLEEVAKENWLNDNTISNAWREPYIKGFKAGAKWQQQQETEQRDEFAIAFSDWKDMNTIHIGNRFYKLNKHSNQYYTTKELLEIFKKQHNGK